MGDVVARFSRRQADVRRRVRGRARRRGAAGWWLPLLVLLVLLPLPARAAVEYFPIPAVSTSKNDGEDAGLIVPILISTPEGELQYLIAPMVIHNSIVGARGTVNLFAYGLRGEVLRVVASYTEEIERRFSLRYVDPAFGQGRFFLGFGGAFFKNATSRFFGLGPSTPESDETNYTNRELRADWQLGLRLNDVTQIAIAQRYREVELQRGATDLPFTLSRFPGVDGGGGASILGHRAIFNYDTRDHLVTPTDGTQVMASAEVNLNFENAEHLVYYRYELEVKKLFPSPSKRVILVLRGDLQATFGTQVPFYERSSLGGQNNLRGFGEDRFIDKQLLVFNAEQRMHVLRTRIFNVYADFELAPFVDIGRVFNTFGDLQLADDFEVTPGLGFRGIVRPNVVGRVDYGYSSEGGAVFAGLDFPF